MGIRTNSGARLKRLWNIPAKQVRYHFEGTFYMPITEFPGALADRYGYVIVESEASYLVNPSFDHRGSLRNPRLGVPAGISRLQGYVKGRNQT